MKKCNLKLVFDKQGVLLPIEQRTYTTNEGVEIVLVDGGSKTKYVTVCFMSKIEYTKEVSIDQIKSGEVKCHYHPALYGVGHLGIGSFKSRENKKLTKVYSVWNDMLRRAYDSKYHERQPTYKDVTVCEQWHNYQAFAEWFEKSNYQEGWQLDKDLLIKGNKEYGPDACIFIPQALNVFLISDINTNTSGYRGVSLSKERNKWIAQIGGIDSAKSKNIGRFNTKIEASEAYNKARAEQALVWKDTMKDKLPQQALDAIK